jgi:ribosome recycling factor
MEQDRKAKPVREAVGILGKLGRLVRGRVAEFAHDKGEEAGETLRQVREELDQELESLEKNKP